MESYCSAVRLGIKGDDAFALDGKQLSTEIHWSMTGKTCAGLGVEVLPSGEILVAGGENVLLWLCADIPVIVQSGCARPLLLCELFVDGEAHGCDGGVTALGETRFFHVSALAPVSAPVSRISCALRFAGDIGSVTGRISGEHASLFLLRETKEKIFCGE